MGYDMDSARELITDEAYEAAGVFAGHTDEALFVAGLATLIGQGVVTPGRFRWIQIGNTKHWEKVAP